MAISAVVLLNAMPGYVQQERAESAIAALRQMACAIVASTALWLRELEKLLRRRTQVTA